jgi:hypothetical protein
MLCYHTQADSLNVTGRIFHIVLSCLTNSKVLCSFFKCFLSSIRQIVVIKVDFHRDTILRERSSQHLTTKWRVSQ